MDVTDARRMAALRMRNGLHRRAAFDEGVGVLQQWGGDAAVDVRRVLYQDYGSAGQEIEAARVVAIVNAAADPGADPDWD